MQTILATGKEKVCNTCYYEHYNPKTNNFELTQDPLFEKNSLKENQKCNDLTCECKLCNHKGVAN